MTPTGRSLLLTGLTVAVVVVLAVVLSAILAPERDRGRPVLIIAHRGASAYAPHDTVAAAREAVERGADALEADVRQTRDGHLVALFHPTLAPTTNVEDVFPRRAPWRVESFTLAETRRLDAGSWFGPEFSDVRVPTLVELADAIEGTGVRMIIEVKTPQRYPGIVGRVVRQVRSRPDLYREIESFDWRLLRRLATQELPVRLGAAGKPPTARLDEFTSFVHAVNPQLAGIDAAYVDRAHELGLEVKVWSLNERSAVRRALRLGVDGIYSHRPDMVSAVLGR